MAPARDGAELPVLKGPAPDFGERGLVEPGRRRLAEKAQRGAQRRGRRICVDRVCARLLRQLLARGIGGDRQVGVGRLRHAEQALQMDLAGGGVEQVGAAHHVGDARLGIIHHHRQLVGEQAVGAQHHVVAGVEREIFLLPALDGVLEADRALGAHPPGARPASGGQAVAAGARIAPRAVARECRVRHFAPGTGAGEGMAGRFQPIEGSLVSVPAAALPYDFAVPFEAEARKRGDDAPGRAHDSAWRIDILDPQQPAAAAVARFQVAACRRDQRAEMQRAAGRGREAADVGRGCGHAGRVHGNANEVPAGLWRIPQFCIDSWPSALKEAPGAHTGRPAPRRGKRN